MVVFPSALLPPILTPKIKPSPGCPPPTWDNSCFFPKCLAAQSPPGPELPPSPLRILQPTGTELCSKKILICS